jgi:polar amino acid transport system permease protein
VAERRAPAGFRSPRRAALAALPLALLAWSALLLALLALDRSLVEPGAGRALLRALSFGLQLASASVLFYAGRALLRARRAHALASAGSLPEARVAAEDARTDASWVLGLGIAVLIAAFLSWFLSANDGRIRTVFLDWELIWRGRNALLRGFWLNAKIALLAEGLVLVWALLVAVLRQLPGRGALPVRWLAIAYCDVFRGVPAVIVIYAIVLGFPLARVPPFAAMQDKDAQRLWLAVLSLVLVYGAYLAEVYRAGLESVHPSQVSAARSLGLSHAQTLRFVVVPQAVRRIVPPLLNDFIALQKDTALVSFAGLVDILGQANLLKNKYFNLSPVFGAALFFLIVTIPMTRWVDRLLARDQARTRAG